MTGPNDPPQSPLGALQVIVGLIAGLAGLIYVTGGALLGLRLLWSDLPGLVVAQLPREFLFSYGAAQVVVPALLIGVVVGLFELGQRDAGLRGGHKPWGEGMALSDLRKAYIAFYAAVPIAIVTPGAILAVLQDDRIGWEPLYAAVLAIAGLLAVGLWVRETRRVAKRRKETPDDELGADSDLRIGEDEQSLTRPEGFLIIAPGLSYFVAVALVLALAEDQLRYFGLIGAWVVSLLVAMLVLWIRGQVGTRYRLLPRVPQPGPWYIMLSWAATALLVVPGIMAVVSVWPLREAVACVNRATEQPADDVPGFFVGETKERVYIGDESRGIISIPTAQVSRLIIGDKAADQALCDPSTT